MTPNQISEISHDLRNKVTVDVLKSINNNIDLLISALPDPSNHKAQMAILNLPAAATAAALTSTIVTAGAIMHAGKSGNYDFCEQDVADAVGLMILTLYRQGGIVNPRTSIKELTQNLAENVSEALLKVLPKHKLDIL
jgi:hypothetical protein